jgi:ribosome-binding factor A
MQINLCIKKVIYILVEENRMFIVVITNEVVCNNNKKKAYVYINGLVDKSIRAEWNKTMNWRSTVYV